MFKVNEDNSIYLTRGDVVYLYATAEDDGVPFQFQPGDVLRIKVYDKKGCENVVLQKDFPVTEVTEKATILLTEEDTKLGDVINKPKDYWYEVELNPGSYPITIVGYDEDGPALFKLFPEGADIETDTPQITPEDIPIVDEELDLLSERPVQNRAITKMFISLLAGYDEVRGAITGTQENPAESVTLKDRSTGKSYTLYVDNGSLTVEEAVTAAAADESA